MVNKPVDWDYFSFAARMFGEELENINFSFAAVSTAARGTLTHSSRYYETGVELPAEDKEILGRIQGILNDMVTASKKRNLDGTKRLMLKFIDVVNSRVKGKKRWYEFWK